MKCIFLVKFVICVLQFLASLLWMMSSLFSKYLKLRSSLIINIYVNKKVSIIKRFLTHVRKNYYVIQNCKKIFKSCNYSIDSICSYVWLSFLIYGSAFTYHLLSQRLQLYTPTLADDCTSLTPLSEKTLVLA